MDIAVSGVGQLNNCPAHRLRGDAAARSEKEKSNATTAHQKAASASARQAAHPLRNL